MHGFLLLGIVLTIIYCAVAWMIGYFANLPLLIIFTGMYIFFSWKDGLFVPSGLKGTGLKFYTFWDYAAVLYNAFILGIAWGTAGYVRDWWNFSGFGHWMEEVFLR